MIRRSAFVLPLLFLGAVAGYGQYQGAKKAHPPVHAGYIVDAACASDMIGKSNAMNLAAAHTKECALRESCAPSGYGIFEKGKWYKFDHAGDAMAKEFLAKTKLEKNIMIDVKGELLGDTLTVASIKEHQQHTMSKKSVRKG